MQERALFRLLPAAAGTIPWLPLAQLPTQLVVATLHTAHGAIDILTKNDGQTATPYGGNKVRKLEFLLAEARRNNATRVITAGAFGSHHALATSAFARKVGLQATVVLFPQRMTSHVRDILLMIKGLGAEVRFTRRMEFVPVALRRARAAHGAASSIIPPGGSNAVGTLGYVECGLELAEQLRTLDRTRPERIHVAAGTLGTVAGLAIGLAIARVEVDIAATRITSTLVTNERNLARLVRSTLALLAGTSPAFVVPSVSDVMRRICLVHDQIGEGYGRATTAGDDATRRFASAGIHLDATYTAKAAAALLADPLTAAGKTMYLHTLSSVEPLDVTADVDIDDFPRDIAARLKAFNLS
jgi:1-aminocyclopropane-1-carboxylate deaminase/D-cysteine desulfhydrase-like pyridoxal-dependent ACC family enzyme